MNQDYLEFILRFGPIIHVILFIAFLAIPVALFMIWNELAKMNERMRIRSVLDDARNPFDEGKSRCS